MNYDVFISYHTKSAKHITEAVCNELESRKIRCWYAPRNTMDEYAGSIANVINNSKIFLLILNKEASDSFDCLNEINLACDRIRNGEQVHIVPFQIDDKDISGDAKYYLGRFHWIDAITPPLEKRIKELSDRIEYLLDNKQEIDSEEGNKDVYKLGSTSIVSSPYFVGREKEIEAIYNNLEEYGKVFLYGMGGIGKSEIAKKYANIYKKNYDTVIFAVYEKDLISTILNDKYFNVNNFNRKITDKGEESDEEFFIRKLDEIKKISNNKTLIILDNFDVDNDIYLKDLLEGDYHLIITTRNSFKQLRLPIIEVNAMKEKEELLKLFKDNYELPINEDDYDTIYKIIDLLEGHTLAIELVANVMQESRIKPNIMLETIKEKGISNIKGEVSRAFKTYDSISSCISLVFDLSMLTDIDKKILKYLYMFPLSGVGFDDFMDLTSIEDGTLINKLIKRNIVKCNYITDNLSLHPLILSAIENELNPSFEDSYIILKNLSNKHIAGNIKNDSKYVHYIEYIYSKYPDISNEEVDIYKEIVRSFTETINLNLAIEIVYKIIDIYKEHEKDNLNEIGKLYHNLEFLYYKQFNFEEAINNIKKANEIAKECNDRVLLIDSYNALSGIYIDIEDIDKAKFYLNKCYEIYNKDEFGLNNTYYYTKLYDAKICLLTKEYDKGLKICNECKEILDEIEDKNNRYKTGALLKLLGQIHIELKDYNKAICELEGAKEIREQGKDEVGILRINYSLIDAYMGQKDYKMALNILYDAKESLEKKFIRPKWYKEVLKKIEICQREIDDKNL